MGMLAMNPENVPETVWRSAMSTYHKTLRKNPGMAWQEAILAALNAWPGMSTGPNIYGRQDAVMHLPLPQEK